jgi:SNF2 family DNA or RNA helicase
MSGQPPPLWAHQKDGVFRATSQHNFAFFAEVGTGKSRMVIETLAARYKEKGFGKTLIFTPPIVVGQFRGEWIRYTGIKPQLVVALQGSQVKRLKDFLYNSAVPKIFITNYEALSMKGLYSAFLDWAPEFIVWDESHKLKAHDSARAKLAADLSNPYDKKLKKPKPKPHTYLMTGTPVLNSPMDLFQQCKVLDGGKTFGDNIWAFRAKYFRDRNAHMPSQKHFPDWRPMEKKRDGFDAVGEINQKLQEISMRVEKKDCLDLPPEVDITVKTEMSPKQAKAYQEMKQELVTYLGDKACVATLALTKALRLMQIASGFLTVAGDDGPATISFDENAKKDALKGLLEEITSDPKNKCIIWSVWKETYNHIREVATALGLELVEVHGEISESKKRANIDRFRSDGALRLILLHPASGGTGLNLVEAGYSIRYSRTFSLEQYLQSRARNHRGGSLEAGHEKIVYYELCAANSIDETVCSKLKNKIDMSESLLANLIQELKN